MAYIGCGDITLKDSLYVLWCSITELDNVPFCLTFSLVPYKISPYDISSESFFSSCFPSHYVDNILRANNVIELDFEPASRLVVFLACNEARQELSWLRSCVRSRFGLSDLPESNLRLCRRQLEYNAILAFRASYRRLLDAAIAAETA